MSQEAEKATTGTTETKPAAENAAAPSTTERIYKQSDVDSLMDKVRQTEAKKLEAAQAELEKHRQASLSESEKAIEKAKADAIAEERKRLAEVERRFQVREALMKAGAEDVDLAVSAASGIQGVDDLSPEEIATKLRERAAGLFGGKKHNTLPGEGGNATNGEPTTLEEMEALIDNATGDERTALVRKFGPTMNEMRSKRMGVSTVAPGAGLSVTMSEGQRVARKG